MPKATSGGKAARPATAPGRTVAAPGRIVKAAAPAPATSPAKAPAKAAKAPATKAPAKAAPAAPAKAAPGKVAAATKKAAKSPAKKAPSARRSAGRDLASAAEAARTVASAQPSGGEGTIPSSEARARAAGVGPTGRKKPVFPEPKPLKKHGPARILAMCNQKGGVGKTTTTINLGASLAELGRKVLLVDFDPQGALSVGLGVNPLALEQTVHNLLMEPGVTAEDVLLRTDVPNLDLLPSNIDLSAAEVQLVNEVAREQTLARALAPIAGDYDVILVDCQPSLGLLTVNALTAAHGVIIPTEAEFFALRGVALLIQTIEKIRERLNPDLELEGILATMYDARTLHGREVLARIVEAFGDRVFHTVINRTVRFPETTVAGEPITTYATSSAGATAYRELAKELLAR
ncbi:MAG: chromosome partitioning protein [Frankiales bacterium]|nr:chromosome partitioning protein [Frankiales bacterium]